jgi:hypothetical protein
MLVVGLIAGCAPAIYRAAGPESRQAYTVTPSQETYSIVLRQLAQMGYSVSAADREAGFIRAEQERPSRFPWAKLYDMLAVTIAPGDAPGSIVRVIGTTDMLPLNGRRRPDNPSATVRADASSLLRALVPNPGT